MSDNDELVSVLKFCKDYLWTLRQRDDLGFTQADYFEIGRAVIKAQNALINIGKL